MPGRSVVPGGMTLGLANPVHGLQPGVPRSLSIRESVCFFVWESVVSFGTHSAPNTDAEKSNQQMDLDRGIAPLEDSASRRRK